MNFLFEIGVEELPSRYVNSSEKELEKLISEKLKEERIGYKSLKSYSTPRRVAVLAEGLSDKQEELYKKSLGPSVEVAFKDGKLTKAGEGFLKGQDAQESDIKIIENEKGKYISIEKYYAGHVTKEILPDILDSSIRSLSFDKSMKWSDKQFRFARPIKWILALLDNEILDFEFEGIKSSNKTRGMRNFASQEIEVKDIMDYENILEKNFVIADSGKRKEKILNSIKENCENDGDKVIVNDYLLDEVVNLVEYPYAIKGEFSENYLDLPEDIITITMETHQRYFPVRNSSGKLSNKFVLIRNAPEYSKLVKNGNEKVIEPRLADAKFFYDEDLKVKLAENVEKLKHVVFQKDMGTIYEKIERMGKITDYLVEVLNLSDKKEDIKKTVYLSKADLVSNVIGEKEFTKLQGFMGEIYAKHEGEKESVAKGIFEHYLPRYQGDILPTTIEGAVSGIADKIDTIVGCFSVGLIPTSSKDPYALRRAAQGIISVCLSQNLDINYSDLIDKTLEIFKEEKKISGNEKEILLQIKEFFKQRLLYILSEDLNKELITYIINIEERIVTLKNRVSILEELSKTDKFEILVNLLKRTRNILKENKVIFETVKESIFEKNEEQELFNYIKELEKTINNQEFYHIIETLLKNAHIINNFFDNVMIIVDNESIKNNRLNLLKSLENLTSRTIFV
ncbi:MAG: glycine--tRNA ligase subunit beta [Sebaldella sp.]|nr:glycine--tRNA ligase subunit beta [Sebaldella sp.]